MLKTLLIVALCFVVLPATAQQVYVLGIAQDGGFPHLGCAKKCCAVAWEHPEIKRSVVALAVVDTPSRQWWLVEATPDIKEQLQNFKMLTGGRYPYLPAGIFITHAHIGHYTGLMQLGREVMNTKNVPVFAMPKMKVYLETNGPWSQLATLGNIKLEPIAADSTVRLSGALAITPFLVPHRDEFSETVGFKLKTGDKKFLFIPDIDKWSKWQRNIIEEVKAVDIALLDGTFYSDTELPGRNMSEVPHPFILETMQLFRDESDATRAKVHFIHFNHTNPLLLDKKKQHEVTKAGYKIAQQGAKL